MTKTSHLRQRRRMTSLTSPLLDIVTIILLSTTAIVVAQDCTTITDWQSLRTAIDATAVAAAEQIARYENAQDENDQIDHPPSLRLPQPQVLLLCPFDIVHDGADGDGYDITTPDLTVACWKGALGGSNDDACTITGTARHFNIAADNVNLAGISIKGSRNGAVVVNDGVQGTTFVGSEFVE